jgi:hypothetical protein
LGLDNPQEHRVATMDHIGHARFAFEGNEAEELARAEAPFKAAVGREFTPDARGSTGEVGIARSFDPTAQQTLFYPRRVGR